MQVGNVHFVKEKEYGRQLMIDSERNENIGFGNKYLCQNHTFFFFFEKKKKKEKNQTTNCIMLLEVEFYLFVLYKHNGK